MSLLNDLRLMEQALDDYLHELCDIYGNAIVNYEAQLIDYCNERISVLHPLLFRLKDYIDLLALEDK